MEISKFAAIGSLESTVNLKWD